MALVEMFIDDYRLCSTPQELPLVAVCADENDKTEVFFSPVSMHKDKEDGCYVFPFVVQNLSDEASKDDAKDYAMSALSLGMVDGWAGTISVLWISEDTTATGRAIAGALKLPVDAYRTKEELAMAAVPAAKH